MSLKFNDLELNMNQLHITTFAWALVTAIGLGHPSAAAAPPSCYAGELAPLRSSVDTYVWLVDTSSEAGAVKQKLFETTKALAEKTAVANARRFVVLLFCLMRAMPLANR